MSQIASPSEAVPYEGDRFSRLNYLAKLSFKASGKLNLDFLEILIRLIMILTELLIIQAQMIQI